ALRRAAVGGGRRGVPPAPRVGDTQGRKLSRSADQRAGRSYAAHMGGGTAPLARGGSDRRSAADDSLSAHRRGRDGRGRRERHEPRRAGPEESSPAAAVRAPDGGAMSDPHWQGALLGEDSAGARVYGHGNPTQRPGRRFGRYADARDQRRPVGAPGPR